MLHFDSLVIKTVSSDETLSVDKHETIYVCLIYF